MHRTILTAVTALALCTPAAHIFGAEQPGLAFACTNLASGAAWHITIDFKAGTVDSNPARISGTEIAWHDAADGGNYTLNRRTGDLTVIFASSTGGYAIHDHCVPRAGH